MKIPLEERIMKWVRILSVLLILFVAILLSLKLIEDLLKFSLGKISANWDALAFVATLITGGITLYGIRISISYPYNRELINTYPRRRKLADDIMHATLDTWRLTKRFYAEKEYDKMQAAVLEWLGKQDEFFEKASHVNDNIYFETRQLNNIYSDFEYLLQFEKKVIEEHKERLEAYFKDLNLTNINLSNEIDKIEKEYLELKRRYR
ncbi:hypothetical protein [Paenibacillus sp. R14(2021)]|uniref:hypothetical protein n=1 Tax=Paenibacillus sp. R14(2021) TaxID=2859228 RepID=UPI001C61459A|nr:hypothetical protein [Paenibacillus sp. R14(2021)]